MATTRCNGRITLASKPGERKLTAIRQKAHQPAQPLTITLKQKEYVKTKQRPALVDIRNKTSRIPVRDGANKAKIASKENDICTRNRKVAPEVAKKALAATDREEVGEQGSGEHCREHRHMRRRTYKVPAPMFPADTIPQGIQDVDAEDEDDPLMCQEYVRDICNNMLALEMDSCYTIKEGFLKGRSEVQSWHRAVLIDWLIMVQSKSGLRQETLFICVDTIDRYLQVVDVAKDKLQLVGMTALLISSKYEEVYPPRIRDFAYVTEDAYSTQEIREMEREILRRLSYRLNKPIPIHFLRRYSKVGEVNIEEYNLAKYILELSLLDATLSSMPPSKRAAGAFLLAKSLLNKETPQQLWTPTLAYYSQYTLSDLLEAISKLHQALKEGHTSSKYKIREKYAKTTFMKVSTLPVFQVL